jgi:hypothetical protein
MAGDWNFQWNGVGDSLDCKNFILLGLQKVENFTRFKRNNQKIFCHYKHFIVLYDPRQREERKKMDFEKVYFTGSFTKKSKQKKVSKSLQIFVVFFS